VGDYIRLTLKVSSMNGRNIVVGEVGKNR